MLSSIGLGSVQALFQPSTAPVEGSSGPKSSDSVKVDSASGESASGRQTPAPAASSGTGSKSYTSAPSSAAAVSASQVVKPVRQGMSDASAAYAVRQEAGTDRDSELAATTQREIFRAQLIGRMAQEPETPGPTSSSASGRSGGAYAPGPAMINESQLDYSY